VDLDSVLPPDHQARLVWGYVERQDWSELEDRIKARGSAPGRRAIDPRILFALWLYATLQGAGSGREIARLSRTHDAYRWICGGVGVNYHALNDFRAENEWWFDELLSDNVGHSSFQGVDKPLLDAAGRRLENFTRVETFGDNAGNGTNDVMWLKVHADARNREVFSYQPMIVPANRVAVPAP
jgi:hypothetical protein